MEIFSRYKRVNTIPAPECPKTEQRYIEKIDKNGHSYLVEGEVVPFYDNIQKYKDECDVYKILSRYESGDPDALSKLSGVGGAFGDFSDLPTDIIDIKNKLRSAELLFEKLPLEERQECDNNVNVFLSNLTQGILPKSIKKQLGIVEENLSAKQEQAIENATAQGPATIQEAIQNGGNA